MFEVIITMLHRYSRLELIVGKEGFQRLANSTVAVFGLGGVGGGAVEALARAGVGNLVLVDFDTVCVTNINRQIIALESTIGRPKTEVMEERVKEINPDCQTICYNTKYTAENSSQLLSTSYDYVIDAIDMVTSKLHLIESCYQQRIPIISAMGAGNKLDPTKLQVVDISQTHICPLARVVRTELRKRGINQGIQVVYSTERPIRHNQGQNSRTPGSSSVVPPVAGFIMASVVIRSILGIEG